MQYYTISVEKGLQSTAVEKVLNFLGSSEKNKRCISQLRLTVLCVCALRLQVCDNLCAIWWIAVEEVWNLALFFFMDLSHDDTLLFSWTYQTFCAFVWLHLYLCICLFKKTNPPENDTNTRLTTPVLFWHQLFRSPAECARKIERYWKVKVKNTVMPDWLFGMVIFHNDMF